MKKLLLGILVSACAYASYITVPVDTSSFVTGGPFTSNVIPTGNGTGLSNSTLTYDGTSLSKTTDGAYTLGTMTAGVGAGRPSRMFTSIQGVAGSLGTHALSGSVLFATTPGFAAVGNNNAGLSTDTYGTSVNGENAHFRARGTNTVPTAVQSNDVLGVFSATGFNGTTWQIESARRNFSITAVADETFTASAMGTRVNFNSIETGQVVPTNHIQIDGLGNTNFRNGNASVSELTNLNSNTSSSIWTGFAARPQFYLASITQAPTFAAEKFGTGVNGHARLVLRRAGGTNTAPTALTNGEDISALTTGGYDGTTFLNTVEQRVTASENWSATNRGSTYTVYTTKNGSGEVLTGRVHIDEDGDTNLFTGNFWLNESGKSILFTNDGLNNIGALGANRPGNAYVATQSHVGVHGSVNNDFGSDTTGKMLGVGTEDAFSTLYSQVYSNSAGAVPGLYLARSKGTSTVPLPATVGNSIGLVAFGGHLDTDFYYLGASIRVLASENWSDSAGGTEMHFKVTANGNVDDGADALVLENDLDSAHQGNIIAAVAGKGLQVKEGSNARMGTAVLVGGTVTVANTSVTANTRVFYSVSTAGGTQGFLSQTQIAATSFTINSTSVLDTSTVNWMLVEPAP